MSKCTIKDSGNDVTELHYIGTYSYEQKYVHISFK